MINQMLLYGGLAGALITLVISIIIFIKLDIVQVFRDLLGIRPNPKRVKARRSKDKREKNTTNNFAMYSTEVSEGSKETELLIDETAASLQMPEGEDETTLLTADWEETTLLAENTEKTAILGEEQEPAKNYFKKQLDIIIVHSDIKI